MKRRLRKGNCLLFATTVCATSWFIGECVARFQAKKETILSTVYEPKEVFQEVMYEEPITEEIIKNPVYFTNYYTGDGSSTHKTGSGLTTLDFEVNDLGWYTYKGKVVVAAATNEGLKDTFGVLKNYMTPEEGITYYNYGDELIIEFDGIEYEAIVLDTCGASMNKAYLEAADGGLNRIDIFISDKVKRFGKVRGYVYESSN